MLQLYWLQYCAWLLCNVEFDHDSLSTVECPACIPEPEHCLYQLLASV